jgi:acetoin utilization deacetylase AcuC-like enzyme
MEGSIYGEGARHLPGKVPGTFSEVKMTAGYVYDPIFLEHNLAGHPENRERLLRTMALLEERGVLPELKAIEVTPISMERLTRVHPMSYVETVRQVAMRGGGYLDPDTYVSSRSFEAALAAAGGLVNATLSTLQGDNDNAFALVRPPGHHALPDHGMGFCLFSNIAIAARTALAEGGIERVLIADFDVHHGNGTQDVFYEDPAVLYFSTHQYPHYPGTGHWREIGRGKGEGTTINVPLSAGIGDKGFARIYDEVLVPAARRYKPQLILVSAGYDAHWDDPLAGLALSLTGYADLVRRLIALAQEVCGGKIVFTLEGGYHLQVLSYGILNTLRLLSGHDDVEDPLGPSPWAEPSIDALLNQIKEIHGL